VLHVRSTDTETADVVAMRRGRQVLVCVSDDHLTKRGAKAINAALEHLAASETPDPIDEIC
jgi:hypothetical protein